MTFQTHFKSYAKSISSLSYDTSNIQVCFGVVYSLNCSMLIIFFILEMATIHSPTKTIQMHTFRKRAVIQQPNMRSKWFIVRLRAYRLPFQTHFKLHLCRHFLFWFDHSNIHASIKTFLSFIYFHQKHQNCDFTNCTPPQNTPECLKCRS